MAARPLASAPRARLRRYAAALALLAGWLAAAEARAQPAPAVYTRYEEGRLTLAARDAAADRVLAAITEATGVRFDVDPGIDLGRVTLQLDDLELERAVRLLLERLPNAPARTLAYAPDAEGRPGLTSVRIFAAPKLPPAPAASLGEAPPAPSEPAVRFDAPIEAPPPDLEDEANDPDDDAAADAASEPEAVEGAAGAPAVPAFGAAAFDAGLVTGHETIEDVPEDLRPDVGQLMESGVPVREAVRRVLVEDRRQEALERLRASGGNGAGIPLPTE